MARKRFVLLLPALLLMPVTVQAEELCPGLEREWPNGPITPLPESDITAEAATQAIKKLEYGFKTMRDDEYFVTAKLVQGYGLKKMAEVSVPGNPIRDRYCEWLNNEWYWPE